MSFVLPPLRRQILVQIIKIVLLFASLGFTLIVIIQESISNPKLIIRQNHIITNEVINMLESWDLLNFKLAVKNPSAVNELKEKFKTSLTWFKKNSKNPAEQIIIKEIEEVWQKQNKNNIFPVKEAEYIRMRHLLIRLITENQVNVGQTLNNQISFSKRMAFIACIIFLVGLGISIYFSEKLSSSIVQPIKRITEVLQNRPTLSERLKFPTPSSLEIKVLIMELNDLWKRLSELNAKNIQNLELQKREMEVIFSAMEDAAVFLDSQSRIQYYNQGFLDILETSDPKFILDQKWDDLSLMSESYLQLRNLVRKEMNGEVLFAFVVNGEDRIYRARKKIVEDGQHNKIGLILLLHDITKKLPTDKYTHTLHILKSRNGFPPSRE